jgi:hypothetical protein
MNPTDLSRRRLIIGAAAAGASTLLPGCGDSVAAAAGFWPAHASW